MKRDLLDLRSLTMAELDGLLASLKDGTPAEAAAEEPAAEEGSEVEMDPELAKLLKGM